MVRLGRELSPILKNSFIVSDDLTGMITICEKKEVIEMERKVKTLMISTVLVLAVLSGIAVMAYANGGTNSTSTAANVVYDYGDGHCGGGPRAFFGRQGGGCGRGEFISVSQEYKDNVINITKSDPDVQKLLADGYNITGVRPMINATVEADGTVAMKATNAVVTLSQNTTCRAFVWVNVEQARVTRIEILAITVIEKP
jgi:hypothetical protein